MSCLPEAGNHNICLSVSFPPLPQGTLAHRNLATHPSSPAPRRPRQALHPILFYPTGRNGKPVPSPHPTWSSIVPCKPQANIVAASQTSCWNASFRRANCLWAHDSASGYTSHYPEQGSCNRGCSFFAILLRVGCFRRSQLCSSLAAIWEWPALCGRPHSRRRQATPEHREAGGSTGYQSQTSHSHILFGQTAQPQLGVLLPGSGMPNCHYCKVYYPLLNGWEQLFWDPPGCHHGSPRTSLFIQ